MRKRKTARSSRLSRPARGSNGCSIRCRESGKDIIKQQPRTSVSPPGLSLTHPPHDPPQPSPQSDHTSERQRRWWAMLAMSTFPCVSLSSPPIECRIDQSRPPYTFPLASPLRFYACCVGGFDLSSWSRSTSSYSVCFFIPSVVLQRRDISRKVAPGRKDRVQERFKHREQVRISNVIMTPFFPSGFVHLDRQTRPLSAWSSVTFAAWKTWTDLFPSQVRLTTSLYSHFQVPKPLLSRSTRPRRRWRYFILWGRQDSYFSRLWTLRF